MTDQSFSAIHSKEQSESMTIEKHADKPFVSIVIPTYNRGGIIAETLSSISAQTFRFWECIVVDDGSDDNTINIVKKFCLRDKRFRFISRNRKPKGAPVCRNIGLAEAAGNYIVFVDSDDVLAPWCLEKRVQTIKSNPGFDFWVFPSAMFKLVPGDSIKKWNILNKTENDLIRFLLQDMPWHTSGPIWKSEKIKQLNGFDEEAICWQDWELHIRAILEQLKYFKSIDETPDSYVRERDASIASSISQNHHNLTHIVYRVHLFSKMFDMVIRKDNTQQARDAFSVIFFRLMKELYQHNAKHHIKELHRIFAQKSVYSLFERLLLKAYTFKLRVNYAERKKKTILNIILFRVNRKVFLNKYNATFQA